jgi:hypothetical protein
MFFRKQSVTMMFAIFIMMTLMACSQAAGMIVILEKANGKVFTMEFNEFNAKNKCELSLMKDDELQIEVSCEEGEVALTISGKNGSEPYTGNGLQSGIFTVTVSETDEYVFKMTGGNATGKVTVKNLGSRRSK